jgi:thiamine kinase-like enzyme
MQRPEPHAIARQAVPGSGEPYLSPLGSGLNNETFRVARDGRLFSMRVALAMTPDSALDRAFELKVLQAASRVSLAPPLVCGDAERGFLIQEWVEGRPWPAASVRESSQIVRIAALLRRVHRLVQPVPARVMRPAAWVEYYAAALAGARIRPTAKLAPAVHARLASLDALPQPPAAVCHSDLHRLNLIESPAPGAAESSLMLLDWEYAHVSEALWDLAGWSANNDFAEPLLRALLGAYLGREPREGEWTRCKLLVWLYDYVCLLWSRLYLNSHRGSAADAIAARATVLQERLGG